MAGISAVPVLIDYEDPDEFVETVIRIAPGFGAIHLEDIRAPECFEIEPRLIDALDVPVMHDDVQGFGSSFNAANLAELKQHSDRVLSTIISAKLAGKQDVTLSGNLAYVNYVMDVEMKTDQGPRPGRTRWTVIFRKMNNRWAVTHFHVSRDPTM